MKIKENMAKQNRAFARRTFIWRRSMHVSIYFY